MQEIEQRRIGQRIKEKRNETYRGTITQKRMAQMMDVPYRTYQNWEMGIAIPKQRFMIKLANLLKADPGWLMYGSKPRVVSSVYEKKTEQVAE